MRIELSSIRVLPLLLWSLLSLLLLKRSHAQDDFVFTPDLLKLTAYSLRLSNVAYSSGDSFFEDAALTIYRDEPDQALVTKLEGYCFAAFRGTVLDRWDDWLQNTMLGDSIVCSDATGACCEVQSGHYQAYFRVNYHEQFIDSVRDCVATCDDGACPLVLTGHSQGGAVAIVAAISLAEFNPTVITFGQPPVVDLPCDAIEHSRIYRFENSRAGWFGPTYDPVPAIPYNAKHIGHQFMLSDDETGVAYIGLDSRKTFWPLDLYNFFATHRLTPRKVGYNTRIEALVEHYRTRGGNVRSNGFLPGTRCSENIECSSNSCSRKRCR